MGHRAVITYTQEHEHFTIAIQHRIIQSTKAGAHITNPRYLSVQHIKQAGKQDQSARPAYIRQVTPVTFFGPLNKNNCILPIFSTSSPVVVTKFGVTPAFTNPCTTGSILHHCKYFLQTVSRIAIWLIIRIV